MWASLGAVTDVLSCRSFVPVQTRNLFCGLHLYLLLQTATPVLSPAASILKGLDQAFMLRRKAALSSDSSPKLLGRFVALCLVELARCSFPRCLKIAIDLGVAAEGRDSWVRRAPIPWHNGFWGRKCYYNLYPQSLGCKSNYHNSEQDRHSDPARAQAGCGEQELGTMGRI